MNRPYHKQRGATLAELIYVIPLFFFLLFGILEMSYVYRTKATLNSATFDAARAGSVNNGSASEMKSALASGMLPQFMRAKATGGQVILAYGESVLFQTKLSAVAKPLSRDTVEIISPTRSVFKKFAKDIPQLDKRKRVKVVKAIPNDNLMFRSTKTNRVSVGGKNVDMNVQDANLLKVRSMWCHPLKVPGLRDIVDRVILRNPLFNSRQQNICNLFGKTPGFRGVYIAVTSQAIVRMQSPMYESNLRN